MALNTSSSVTKPDALALLFRRFFMRRNLLSHKNSASDSFTISLLFLPVSLDKLSNSAANFFDKLTDKTLLISNLLHYNTLQRQNIQVELFSETERDRSMFNVPPIWICSVKSKRLDRTFEPITRWRQSNIGETFFLVN